MSPERRTELRGKLQMMHNALKGSGPETLAPNRDGAPTGSDDDHQPLNEMLQAIASGRNRNRSVVLADIERALETLEDYPEEYGLCLECEEEIPDGRLELMPYAPLCVRCQQTQEESGVSRARKRLNDYV